MLWIDWVLVGFLCLGVLVTVGSIGQPRKPVEPAAAVLSLILTGTLIALFLYNHLS